MSPQWQERDARACRHVQDQELRGKVINQRRQPSVDLGAEIDAQMRTGKLDCTASIDDDRTSAGAADALHDFPRPVETIARRRDYHDDASSAPL